MSKNRRRGASRTKHSSAKSSIQVVRAVSSPQMTSSSKRGFHIDWTQVNFWQFIILLFAPLLLTIIGIFPLLNGLHHLRPEAAIIAGSFITTIVVVAGVLSTGVIKIRKIDPFHPQKFKLKQAVFAIVSGILLSLLLLDIAMLPPAPQPITHSGPPLTTIPYPPYKGVLVLDGMQSRPSKGYYWEQISDSYGSCMFVGSEYHIVAVNHKGFEICSAVNTNFQNFAFEIDMTFLKPGSAFILFETTNQIAYQLTITSIGNGDYAQLSLAALSGLDTQSPHLRGLIGPIPIIVQGQGPVLFTPGDTNRIAVVVDNQTIIPYVNGLTAANWKQKDDSSRQGGIALGAFTSSDIQDTQTEVEFSNARAWTL